MRHPTPLLIVALLCLPIAGVHAEDEAAAPRAAYEAAVAQFPSPGADHAFTFDGEALMNGQPLGTITFKEPTEDGAAWLLTDAFSFGGDAYQRNFTARLDRRLQPAGGKVTGKEPGTDGFEVVWTRTETGFAAKRTATKAGETTTSESTVEHTGTITTTMCSLWLFARLSQVARGNYAVPVYDADPGPGEATFETATWTQGEEGTWGDRKALLLAGAKGDKRIEAGFDPRTGALLGVRTSSPGKGFDLEIRPAGAKPAEETDDPFSRPARSAKEAALQAGLAFAVADLELTERVIHWPSLHAESEAAYTGEEPFPDVEAFKAATMEQLKQSLTKRPRPMIEGALKMARDQLQLEEVAGGLTKVTFPPMFKSLVMTVGEIDGQWYLVRLPGAPK